MLIHLKIVLTMVRLNFALNVLMNIFSLRKWVIYGLLGDVPACFTPNNSCNTNDIFISTFTQVARSYVIDKFPAFH